MGKGSSWGADTREGHGTWRGTGWNASGERRGLGARWGGGDARSRTEAPDGEGRDQHRLLGPGILEEGGESWRGGGKESPLQGTPPVTSNPPATPPPWRSPLVTSASPSGQDHTASTEAPPCPSPRTTGAPGTAGPRAPTEPSLTPGHLGHSVGGSGQPGRGAPWELWSLRQSLRSPRLRERPGTELRSRARGRWGEGRGGEGAEHSGSCGPRAPASVR